MAMAMATEVQAPSPLKFSRYRSRRPGVHGKETKVTPPLPQLSSGIEEPLQDKSRHRHVYGTAELSSEAHGHRHRLRRVRATTIDSRGTPQVHSSSRGPKDVESGAPPSWSQQPDLFSPNAHAELSYRLRNTTADANHSQSSSSLDSAIDSNPSDPHHARDNMERRRRPGATQPGEHCRPLGTEKHDLSFHQFFRKASEDIRPSLPTATQMKEISTTMISSPIGIQPGGRGAIPGIDAPLSAVNAGERKVRVEYKNYSIPLPVSPSTTTVDIICSAAQVLADNDFNPRTIEVVESFKQLGLERPLRPYEDIRDVLNSWAQDDDNALLLQPLDQASDDDLNFTKVPLQQPVETSACMYYSHRPGSWDKRFITLQSDGQIVMSKQERGEAKNVCHMRDFDIYVPTPQQVKKILKPPRKLCFAIKSQHKSSMFVSPGNFVHFFAMRDKSVATSWFKAVQSWRSWYLRHTMGKLQRKSLTPATSREAMVDAKTLNAQDREARRNLGLPPPPPSYSNYHAKDTHAGTVSGRGVIRDPTLVQHKASRSVEQDSGPFTATGLLGRTYTQRRRAQQQREHVSVAEPRHVLPSPVSNAAASTSGRTMSMKHGNHEFYGSNRGATQRQRHKPLVDLTPQFREPPQHARKGRGVVPEQMPAGGLIDIATSPEVAIPVPPATTWRRPVSQ